MSSTTECRQFLAEEILTQDKVINYRQLSRSQGIRANAAKQILYEFHKTQNDRKPGTVHATYLIYGIKSEETHGEDVEMTGSTHEDEPLTEQVPVLTLTLVKEENLEDCLKQYEQVTSLHVYSIGPHPMSDPQLLSEAARQVFQITAPDDPAERSKKYGSINNSHVRRRDRKAPAPQPVASKKPEAKPTPAPATKKEETKPASFFGKAKETAKDEPKSQASGAAKPSQPAPAAVDAKKAPAPAKKGGLMQAFAKSKPKKKKEPAPQPEPAMSDDGEDDSEAVPAPTKVEEEESGPGRKTRKEREEELRRMMEEDDEEEKDREDTPMEDVQEPEEEPEEEKPLAKEPEEPKEVLSASTGDGRRRGRRRVTRKKQVMDEEGYLVTIQEDGWESFSEDDAPAATAPKAKPAAPAASSSTQAAKGKKTGGKGQGNIMSFFSKK